MLTILDKYILKRYLATFTAMLMFVPIGIIIDVSEKINFMIENKIPFLDIAVYYYHFTIYLLIRYFQSFSFIDNLVLPLSWQIPKLSLF
jgi:lipopolysaccharide export system permease protein